MSRIGKKPVPVPKGVTATVDGQTVEVKGPKGELALRRHRRRHGHDRGRRRSRSTPRDESKRRAPHWGMSRTHGRQPRRGRDQGLREEARDHRRRLPRRGAGQDPAAGARLQPRRRLSDPGRHHDHDAEADRDRRRPASTSSRSARSPRRSASFAAPSPTRARASSTRASSSSARKARRSKERDHGEQQARSVPQRRLRVREQLRQGGERPAAAVGVPLVEEHLCPGHRRRRGRDRSPPPRRSTRTWRGKLKTGADMAAATRSASWSPSARWRPASRTSSSTAAATSFTAASRRLPTPPARAA